MTTHGVPDKEFIMNTRNTRKVKETGVNKSLAYVSNLEHTQCN